MTPALSGAQTRLLNCECVLSCGRFNVRVSGAPATGVVWEVWMSPDHVATHNELAHAQVAPPALVGRVIVFDVGG
jgi:hypothetical protein